MKPTTVFVNVPGNWEIGKRVGRCCRSQEDDRILLPRLAPPAGKDVFPQKCVGNAAVSIGCDSIPNLIPVLSTTQSAEGMRKKIESTPRIGFCEGATGRLGSSVTNSYREERRDLVL